MEGEGPPSRGFDAQLMAYRRRLAETGYVEPKRHRDCTSCGMPLVRRDGELRQHWLARQTCDRRCESDRRGQVQAELRAQETAKTCPQCQRPFSRNQAESQPRFQTRKHCSKRCADLAK